MIGNYCCLFMLVELLVYLLFMDDGHHQFLVEGGLSSQSGVEMVGSISLAQCAVFFLCMQKA